ncbi:hypothetical protein JOS77_30795 [Chromobacterium haemolyticum]|nr:hypothetical protein JOS77_30795 [Chromobacterium haemolyticum]
MSSADSQTIRFVFRTLRGRFGNGFVDKFRSDDEKVLDAVTGKMVDPGLLEAMDVWAYELRKLNNADIQHGLTCRFKYPPSADDRYGLLHPRVSAAGAGVQPEPAHRAEDEP